MYRIRPNGRCTKHYLRLFYMHTDGYVPQHYKHRPSTTVPESRLKRVLFVMNTFTREQVIRASKACVYNQAWRE